MITVVSMSPAIDKRLEFESIALWRTNRVLACHTEGAGKAIAVALAATALGSRAQCVGILPGMERTILERLDRNNVRHDFLCAPGSVRTNIKLYDRSQKRITEINEPCPPVTADVLVRAAERVVEYAKSSDFLVLTGSLPEGCPSDWYADMIRRVRMVAPRCRCVLDADGDRLRIGIQARPWLIKPNVEELEQICGCALDAQGTICKERVLAAVRSLLQDGAEVVIASLGAEGAVAVSQKEAYFAPSIPIEAVTTTSAGDAMVAGLLHGFERSHSLRDALQHGMAAATSRCLYGGDACIDPALTQKLLPEIVITRMT